MYLIESVKRGFNPSFGLSAIPTTPVIFFVKLRSSQVSIPHSGLAPFRREEFKNAPPGGKGFNPSFGLSAIPTHFSHRFKHRGSYRFNPSFGLSAIPTIPALKKKLEVIRFNPSFGLSAIPTK